MYFIDQSNKKVNSLKWIFIINRTIINITKIKRFFFVIYTAIVFFEISNILILHIIWINKIILIETTHII
ncbi:hypothetical protein BFC97_27385 [Pseudomonas aeruginosa 39016]|nr:hypothetical protein BFC97_27385 [Pseudomonas aeruginosa 39016]